MIKNLNNYEFDLTGEFKLLNINKLSTLYEVYSLYIIIEALRNNLNLLLFKVNASSKRKDEVLDTITFTNDKYVINFFYELNYHDDSYKNHLTDLRRIDKVGYYNPDFIIEIYNVESNKRKYCILDAKYSKFNNVKYQHLNNVVEKYILKTNVHGESNQKVSKLCLIFPGEFSESIIENDFYEPTIDLLACKPNFERDLQLFVRNILKKNIRNEYLSKC